jgi:hypothetical protein
MGNYVSQSRPEGVYYTKANGMWTGVSTEYLDPMRGDPMGKQYIDNVWMRLQTQKSIRDHHNAATVRYNGKRLEVCMRDTDLLKNSRRLIQRGTAA